MSTTLFQKVLKGETVQTPPVWMMRQAGRYHRHYQNLRRQHSFMDLCKKPKLAAEVALGPIEDFDFDVSILFSDLLFPLEALGMGLKYEPAPELSWYLRESSDIKRLRSIQDAIEDLRFQGEAVQETRRLLPSQKSLIGFVGSPWTLFVYAVLGTHKGLLTEVKTQMKLFKEFSDYISPLIEANIQIQLQGGAEAVMVFDTAAGELSAQDFRQYVEPTILNWSRRFPKQLGYYSKNTLSAHLQNLWSQSELAGFGYDHRWDLTTLFGKSSGFTQGNFDQSLLFLSESEFEKYFRQFLKPFQQLKPEQRRGWVCGLGHGVLPETPEQNVRRFVQILRESF